MIFSSGLPRVGDAWRLANATVRFAGYTAIGKVELHELPVPAVGSLRPLPPNSGQPRKEGVLRLAMLEGFAAPTRSAIVDWVKRTVEAEANYWHGFTAEQMLVGLVPMSRNGVGFGRTQPGGGVTIMIEVGDSIDQRRLFNDWVLVHELIHSGMPFIRGRASWFMEGSATYIEPIIRARAGWKTEEEVWMEWVTQMPQGAGVFARGLAESGGRENYWGGAIFMLLADTAIRRDSNGAKGLEDCLAGALWRGMGGADRVGIDAYTQACDAATGTKAMSGLIDRHFNKAEAVDLPKLWKELGVALVGGRIVLDDSAPQAKWRKMIVMGPPGHTPRPVKLPWES
jgi:predicted metalloprotease with PDZ domain